MRWFLGAVLVSVAATSGWAGDDSAAPPPVAQYEGKSAAQWTSQLASEDVKLRQKAAYALFKLGPDAKAAALPLVVAIRDADPYVRTTSAKAVGKLGPDAVKPVAAELASEMFDERPEVRREAASLLWRLGPLSSAVVPELTKALASPDASVRANAAGSLGNAGAAAKSALPAIARALGDDDESVRRWAAKALVEIDLAAALASERPEVRIAAYEKWSDPSQRGWTKPEIVAAVVKGLDDPDENARAWAVHTLDTFAAFAGDAPPAEWIPLFRRLLEKDRSPAVRARGAGGLGRYPAHSAEIVPVLLPFATSREPEVCQAALLALAQFGRDARTAVPAALDALRSGDAGTRRVGAYVLAPLGDASGEAIAALIQATHDESPSVRTSAVSSLASLGKGSPRVAEALVAALHDETSPPYVRESVAHALADVGVPAVALPALTEAFEKDPDASLNVARSLVVLDAPSSAKAMDCLIRRLAAPDDVFQPLALLRQLGPKAAPAVPALSRILDGAEMHSRIGAAETLAAIGPAAKDALPALDRAAAGSDADVAAAAKNAIESVRGRSEPPK